MNVEYIGILQCGQAPAELKQDMGDYPDMFVRLLDGRGFQFRTWHVEEMEFPASVHDADGWLLTGSRHGAYEDHDFIPPLERFIRDAYDAAVPMVGICFGHQIIAQALGGTVVKHPGGWSVGMTWTWPSRGRPVMLTGCGRRGRCCARDGLTLVLLVSRGWGGPGWSIGVGAACVPISPGG